MNLVCVSDLHLDQSTAGVDRYDDICRGIDVSVDAAIELEVDAYLMCGDLTDPNNVRSHRAVAKAIEIQRILAANDIQTIFVAGNHDVIEDGSGRTTMSPIAATGRGLVFEAPGIEAVCGVTVIALPFTSTSHDYDPADHIRTAHAHLQGGDKEDAERPVLIVGHLNLEGISPGSETTDMPRGRNVYWPMDAIHECFPNATVIGGHYHTPQEYNGVTIIGSMVRLRFDERDNTPGYIVVEL